MTHRFEVPASHPRAVSLGIREQLVRAWEAGLVADAGLMAHGRGEAFDYLLGEETIPPAQKAIHTAAAMLLSSNSAVISVNGNAAALTPQQLVTLAQVSNAKLEVNLFYYSRKRAVKIAEILRQNGADEVLGVESKNSTSLPGLESNRRRVDQRGISRADTVLIPLEDGDRTEALRNLGKRVIAIDLNPLSRTSRAASITIVDNIVRAVPSMVSECERLARLPSAELQSIIMSFDNQANLREVIRFILGRLETLSKQELALEALR